MSKTKIKMIAAVLFVSGVIIVHLFSNRARLNAEVKSEIKTAVPVMTVEIHRQRLSLDISLVGTVEANNEVAVVSETQGRVTKVAAEIGDRLSSNDMIVQVDDELKRSALTASEVAHEKAKKDLDRFQKLYDEKTISASEFENIRLAFKAAEAQYIASQRQFNDTRITTPISGVVTSRPVDIGTMVQPGMVVARVVDLSRLKVNIMVAERDVFKLKAGDDVKVTTEVYPGTTFDGKIQSISDQADGSHTYPVVVTMDNSREHPLKGGMFARVSFVSVLPEDALAIPREAILGSLRSPQVFVVDGANARLRDIIAGSEVGTKVTVLSGLQDGESVIYAGQNNLTDGDLISIVD